MNDPFLQPTTAHRQRFFTQHRALLQDLAANGQTPRALFVGCADSRLTPELLLDAKPGEFFMLRNVANIIPPYVQTEIGIVSVLEFALLTLRIPHIIVMGHTDCGGLRGLDVQIDMAAQPALSRWLDLARPAQREVDFKLRDLTPAARHVAIVEENVRLQLRNLESYPFVRTAVSAGTLQLHGWVYYLGEQQLGYLDRETGKFRTAV